MARIPSLEHLEGRWAPNLADDDAVGPKSQGVEDGATPRVSRFLHENLDLIRRRALELRGVLHEVHTVLGPRDFAQEGIHKGGLAGSGAAPDEDVRP